MMFNKKQTGLTLIEMMIAMVLGLFVTAVIISVFSTNVRSSTENLKMIRLNQELRGTMTFMIDELNRAGYSSFPVTSTFMNDLSNNDFIVSPNCIRYSYDEDGDSIQDADERFGFQRVGNTIKWAKDFTSSDCSTSSTTPDDITDPNLAFITTLNFDISGSINTDGTSSDSAAFTATSGVSIYDIAITLTGTTGLPHSADPRRTVEETVRIRNEAPK